MADELSMRQRGIRYRIQRRGVAAVMNSGAVGAVVPGLLAAKVPAQGDMDMQGADNPQAPNYYQFTTLSPLPEGYNILTIGAQAFEVTTCQPVPLGTGILCYVSTLLEREGGRL